MWHGAVIKKVVLVVLVGMLVSILLLWLPPVRRGIVSGAVAVQLLVPSGDWRPLDLFTMEPTWRDVQEMTADGRIITVRVYEAGDSPVFGLVIYTPLIGGGLDDERLMNMAGAWARVGIPVAVPWSNEGLAIQVNDIEEVITAAQVLQRETDVKRLGLFGISYGTGPVFAAAIDERLSNHVDLIVSLNGMYDVAHVVEFIDSGQSHEYGREVVAATRAAGISLSEARWHLSPALMVDQLTIPVYIVHSTSDVYIPFTESIKLHEALQMAGVEAKLVLTDVIEHGTYRSLTLATIVNHYMPAGIGFTGLIFDVLAAR